MTRCPSCGAPAAAEARFCGHCGNQLPAEEPWTELRFCTHCGARLEEGSRFCGECGAQLGEPGAEETVAADVLEDEDDLLSDWEFDEVEQPPAPMPDAAITEAIPVAPQAGSDTALLELPAQDERYPPAQPAPVHRREPRPGPSGFPWGATAALLGSVAVIVSSVLRWNGPFGEPLPRDIPFAALFDPAGAVGGPNLGVILLAAGTLGALLALLTMAVPALKFLRRMVGLAVLGLAVGFALRTIQLSLGAGELGRLPELLGAGVYVCGAGAFVQMVAGKWFRR
jgi:hypothetical protein